MSTQFSKRRAGDGGTTESVSAVGNTENMVELSSSQEAFRVDPDFQTFDASLQQRFSCLLSDPAVNVQLPSISFDSTGSLFYVNQDGVSINLESKKNVWKNPKSFQPVVDYFKNSIHTSDSLIALETSLKKARDSQPFVELAKKSFDEEYAVAVAADEEDQPPRKTRYAKTLDEFRQYFFADGIGEFKPVYQQQLSSLGKLQNLEAEQDKKLKSVKIWRNVTRIIFVSAFAALFICSVVAAFEAASRIAAALAAATAIPVGSIGKWFDSKWKDYQDALKVEKELINKMHATTSVVLTYLNNIKILVNRLEDNIRSLSDDAEFVLEDEDAVRPVIEEMRKKIEVFMKIIEDLVQQADQCSRILSRASAVLIVECAIKSFEEEYAVAADEVQPPKTLDELKQYFFFDDTALLICSVVVALKTSPAMPAATMIPNGSIGKRFDSM
ncbi:UPF0496 protein 1-like [Phalaenopsis equestris]|uniref:UPF0496 protein 1-like n=1 Tax=Phalaenopsis equestris TaxID=78828 RepID=UPI0009E63580|nr:UPF0496 protein 1-like [Phalaenopsis equestris]